MGKKSLPQYKSEDYYGSFAVTWFENGGFMFKEKAELIKLFESNGELTPENEVSLKSGYQFNLAKNKSICWQRNTQAGKETIVLGEINPDENFLVFLNKFFMKWHGGYRRTSYCLIRAICNLYEKEPEKFLEMAIKAKNLEEFVVLMGIQ